MEPHQTPSTETNNQDSSFSQISNPTAPTSTSSFNSPNGHFVQSQPGQDSSNGYPLQTPPNPKSYRTIMWAITGGVLLVIILIIVVLLIKNHNSNKNTNSTATKSQSQLQPTQPGDGECSAGANYGQVAISGGATCTTAEAVIADASNANGEDYKSNGYSCSATPAGSLSGTSYVYSCADGNSQIAFNWQPSSTSTPSNSNPGTTTVTIGGAGALQPTLPGDGECGASANFAQIAISGGATCTTAEAVAQAANGSNFTSNGYSCSATTEAKGSNTQWSSYWSGTFYAYTCSNAQKDQIAFNWQSSTASQQENTSQ